MPTRPLSDFGPLVLVQQGGGALGAYQAGAYAALSEAGHEPDWVIGTSIGAINGALIAGNPPELRVAQLREFWRRVEYDWPLQAARMTPFFGQQAANWLTMMMGDPEFFQPNPGAWDLSAKLGPEHAAFYTVAALRKTLDELIALDEIGGEPTRLTVGAANVTTSQMTYFDSARMNLGLDHILASGALPPSFPAVRIGDDLFWDGGILSNTPLEVIFEQSERQSSLVFEVHLWNPVGPAPDSIWDVVTRSKNIQYSSRSAAQVVREKQMQAMRRMIHQLSGHLAPGACDDPEIAHIASLGCSAQLHVVRLMVPHVAHEDYSKDIDFSAQGIKARWTAGLNDMREVLREAPWEGSFDPLEGVIVHEARAGVTVSSG